MKLLCKNLKTQLHIIVVSMAILILSLLCWLSLAKEVAGILIYHFSSKEETVSVSVNTDKDTSNIEEDIDVKVVPQENFYTRVTEELDSLIDFADTKWYSLMYKKSFFSRCDSIITYYVMNEISSKQVVEGRNGWLFYKSTTDGNLIADFEGTNLYSQNELNNICRVTYEVQEDLENRGIKFAILIPPNKENVYYQYMPETYQHASSSATDIMIEHLQSNGVNIINPKDDLLSFSDDDNYQVYYNYDTHWNQMGAYIGVKKVLETWGIIVPRLSDCAFTTTPLKDNYHYCGMDDLAGMIGLNDVFDDDKEYVVTKTAIMDWEKFEKEQSNKQISHFENEEAPTKGTLLLVGDSFRSSMIPLLRQEYADVYVLHRNYYEPSMLDEIEPDFVIVEYVERHSREVVNIDFLIK